MATAAGIALVAVAIGYFVHVVVSLWAPLVVIGGSVLALTGIVWAVRSRRRGW